MNTRLLRDNPLWLLIGSVFIFSLIIALLLLYRKSLFEPQQKKIGASLPTYTLTPTPIPSQQESIAIPYLQTRHYNPTQITIDSTAGSNTLFTSQIISFSVDGLQEYALLDTPTGTPPGGGFPVVMLDHGYIIPSQYNTVTSYETIADFFAKNGYIVMKPDYRGNGNSQGTNDPLQRYNYPIDVMTLLASLAKVPHADSHKVYLWGHSMGGEVTLTVLEILGKQPNLEKNVRAAVLWAPVTDPAKWFSPDNLRKIPEAYLTPFPYSQTLHILGQPSDSSPVWQSINPLNYLSAISAPLQLNHGTADPTVPYNWSQDLVAKMQKAGNQVDFISYPGADHNLSPNTIQALQNNLQFFKSH